MRERNKKKAESQQNRSHLHGKIQKDGVTFSYNNTITNSNTIAQLLSQEEINNGKSPEKTINYASISLICHSGSYLFGCSLAIDYSSTDFR